MSGKLGFARKLATRVHPRFVFFSHALRVKKVSRCNKSEISALIIPVGQHQNVLFFFLNRDSSGSQIRAVYHSPARGPCESKREGQKARKGRGGIFACLLSNFRDGAPFIPILQIERHLQHWGKPSLRCFYTRYITKKMLANLIPFLFRLGGAGRKRNRTPLHLL